MRIARVCIIAFMLLFFCRAESHAESVIADGGCPTLNHQPISTVVRGTPAVIVATVVCSNGIPDDVFLQVRLTELGKPTPIKMVGHGNGVYKATILASMIEGVTRFWYYVDARGTSPDGDPKMAQTTWHLVTIIEAANTSGSESAAGSSGQKGLYWFAGGAAALAGGFAINHESQGHGGGGSSSNSAVGSPPPDEQRSPPQSSSKKKKKPSSPENSSNNPDSPCVTTGSESVSSSATSPCIDDLMMHITIANACPGAALRAEGSWEGMASGTASSGPTTLLLEKPWMYDDLVADVYTIWVYANGVLIETFTWPSAADISGCL